ncbi:MAG: MotA/TolQ/ExbB proton channel family protein [Cellvibrionales bacterium]|nr:MotA/TolQ/ExbB proton channel family protein [Cellvibrionales bacterium]
MPKSLSNEFLFQLGALLAAFILVHLFYIGLVRPNAEALLLAAELAQQAGTATGAERSLWVVLKDYEQQACFVLAFWALAIMGYKAVRVSAEKRLLRLPLIEVPAGSRVLPEDSRALGRNLESLPAEQQDYLLPRAITAALQRLGTAGSVQDIASAVRDLCEAESQRLDTELSMIRYIAWAIPSIGFIGTVRGIGAALANAHEAVAGNIAGVTASLGVAFNSTFIALLISIIVMFLSHQLTLHQERLVLDAQRYCDRNLLRHVQI